MTASKYQNQFVSKIQTASLPTYRAALAAAKANTSGPLIINLIGDSTFAGAGSNGAPMNSNNDRNNGPMVKLEAAYLAGSGLTANGADIWGWNHSNLVTSYALFNNDVTLGSWSYSNHPNTVSLGGALFRATSAAGGDFTWNGKNRVFDKISIYYDTFATNGSFEWFIDGVSQGVVNEAVASDFKVVTVTGLALTTHTVAIRWISGTADFIGIETFDTTNKQSVRIRNWGQIAAPSAQFVNNPTAWSWPSALIKMRTMAPAHLSIIEIGMINDWRTAVAPASTAANLSTTMTNVGGACIIFGPNRADTALTPQVTQEATVSACAALADGKTKVFHDVKTNLGVWSTMNGLGQMFDQQHPNGAGYTAIWNDIYSSKLA